jgi:hypothetical protein
MEMVDDELNIKLQNYGWPPVAGYYDNAGYDYWLRHPLPDTLSQGATPPPHFHNRLIFVAPVATYGSTVSLVRRWRTWPTVPSSGIVLCSTLQM